MAYTVLARRYRSGTFDEVIGQDHVAQTLKKAIASGRIAHAYLFCGTRGVGKTSMARILAKALNCSAFDAPTTQPCGKCESCLAIGRGDDIDVIEIDAASNTGVDNVREVIENSQYRPARSRFKIYIIDEAHMLSKQAFNALLKTLEEPPSHVKFILATTEAEKLLPTILSRCQRYDFRNIPTREIAGHLADICKQEKIKADEDALLLVAKAGAGSMRDALSLLDRLLSIGEKELTADMIEQLLGLPKSQLLFDLAESIGAGDAKATLGQADAMVQAGLSVDSLIASLVDHLRNLLILKTCGPDSTLVEVPGLAMKDLMGQAQRFDAVALTQDITILEELRRTLRQSQAGRALLDATLVRLALSDQFSSIGELLSRLDGNGAAARPPAAARPVPARPPPAPAPAQKKNIELNADGPLAGATESDAAPISQDSDEGDDLPAPGKVWSGPSESLSTLMARHNAASAAAPDAVVDVAPASPARPALSAPVSASASPHAASNVEAVSAGDLPAVWQAMLDLLASHGPMLHSLVSQGRLTGIDDGRIVLRFGPQLETFVKAWDKNGKRDLIQAAASKVLKQTVGVKFEIDSPDRGAATGVETRPAPEAQGRANQPATPRRAFSAPPARQSEPQAATGTSASSLSPPAVPSVKITPELVDALRNAQPLVKAVMDRLGGQVVKVE
ncbi:MAG TPA: DNA polymerase III subunit gamma/tau [Tepidisphaeraceae bacterium]|nr:DNA polymerase III subunit gamma/tau [Tepidisphaeraceae bacterium]